MMKSDYPFLLRGLIFAFMLLAETATAFAQDKPQAKPTEEPAEVVRVNTVLVQTDVMVFDKQGRFVNGLRPEDFELRIDGQEKRISFFDRVAAGSKDEESELAAARGVSSATRRAGTISPAPLDRGRIVLFYVDDLHLAAPSIVATRRLLVSYVDREMGQNDEAAIGSASGQIGFLQQLTDNKVVLRAALNRLEARPYFVRDFERPPMSEYQALAVERNNRDVISYFVDELMKGLPSLPTIAAAQNPGGLPRSRAEQEVRDRAGRILQQAANVTMNTLGGLESLVRTASKLPGRKLVFFVSDGFFLDQRNSDSFQRLQRLTSATAHSGVVIYAMDSRGLTTGLEDASSEAGSDPSGRLQRIAAGELIESQDGMNAIANDTGGRAIFNTNALEAALPQALAETSTYYLLAWRPDDSRQASDQFRQIQVKVIGRPELSVRVRRGFFDVEPEPVAKQVKRDEEKKVANLTEQTSEAKLRTVLAAPFPQQMLPVWLNLSYVDTPAKGLTLTVALQVKREALSFSTENSKRKAAIYLAGAAYNDKGRVGASFGERLELSGPATGPPNNGSDVVYTYVLNVPPGLYQIRAGVRDEATGAIGSAQEWIEIPDLAKQKIVLSSIVAVRGSASIGSPLGTATEGLKTSPDLVNFSVDRRFRFNSSLGFVVFIYSPARPNIQPDVVVRVQVLRNSQPVITTSLRKVSTEGLPDLARLPYAAEISLEHLPAGRYILQVTAIDRASKAADTQSLRFTIE